MTDDAPQGLRYAIRVQVGALMVALVAAGSLIAVPIPGSPVPIVLQNMFVVVTGLVLPGGWAAITVAVYLLLGAVGFPVFAGGTGGLAHFAGPTGGFLLAYPGSAALVSLIVRGRRGARVPSDASPAILALALVLGFVFVYAVGVPWLAVTAGIGIGQATAAGMIPFLPGDLIKAGVLYLMVRTVPRSVWRAFR